MRKKTRRKPQILEIDSNIDISDWVIEEAHHIPSSLPTYRQVLEALVEIIHQAPSTVIVAKASEEVEKDQQ